jgi:hypothetical protein
MNAQPSRDTLRKRKERVTETSEQLELRRARERESKRMKRAETPEQRQLRLSRQRELYRKRKAKGISSPSDARLTQHERVTRNNDSPVNRLDESRQYLHDDSRENRHVALSPKPSTKYFRY